MSVNGSVTLVEQYRRSVELRAWKSHDDESIVNEINLSNIMPPKDVKECNTIVHVKPLLYLVEDILNRVIRNINSTIMEDENYLKDEIQKEEIIFLRDSFNYTLDKIAYEIAYDISSKADLHNTVLLIFKILRNYPWEARLILCLTAFALNYGDCWHLALKHSSHKLTESMDILKNVPDIHKQPDFSPAAMQEVNDLVRATMDVMRCVIDFQKVHSQLLNDKKPRAPDDAYKISNKKFSIPVIIYWSIKSVLVCASMITRFITMDLKYSVSSIEMNEIENLEIKLNKWKESLQNRKKSLDNELGKKKAENTVKTIKSLLEFPQVDNMNFLRALLTSGKDPQPLVKGKEKVDLEDLRKKMVLLLMSGIDISREDIKIMADIHTKSRAKKKQQNQLEIVWLPVINNINDNKWKSKIEEKQREMEWYTVHDPSSIADQVREIGDEWKFKNEPIIVVIDKQGQVANPNAFPMIRIWGYDGYPFTILAEEARWKDKSCNLELLFGNDLLHKYPDLNKSGKQSICVYGGEDMEWIKKFTTRAPSVAEAAKDPLQMLYVGKQEPNRRTQRRITKINTTRSLDFYDQMKFWKRLVNLAHSKLKLGQTIYGDPVLQDIVLILNLGSSGDGWAVLLCGSDIKIIEKGEKILHSFLNFSEWKDNVKQLESIAKTSTSSEVDENRKQSSGFIHALEQHLTMNPYHIDHDKSYKDIIDNKVDGLEILEIFVSAKDNWQPLIRGSKRVNVDVLKNKDLLLLISDCNISQEELASLKHIYRESPNSTGNGKSTYDIVWLPINDPITSQKDFKDKQKQMPWYSVYELSMINEAAIRFIKQFWHYDGRTIGVALGKKNKVQYVHALRKIMIWPQQVISSVTEETIRTEETMWAEEEWSLDLIIDDLHPTMKDWKKEDDIICICGGGDKHWPQNLQNQTRDLKYKQFHLKILYVGKSNVSHQGFSEFEELNVEKLDKTLVQLFWYRIKSMWISKYEIGKEDNIMEEISELLSFDSSGCGWAIMAKGGGGGPVIKAKEQDLLQCLSEYEKWKKQASDEGFLDALQKYLKEIKKPIPCLKFMLSEFAEKKQEAPQCSQCKNRVMQKFVTFKCCGRLKF